jgi:oligopeptidase B
LRRESPCEGFRPDDYAETRLHVQTEDGAEVPVTLLRRHKPEQGRSAGVVHVYGSYGQSTEPFFSVENLALMDLGMTIAYAHVRGGGERGTAWHDQGRGRHKGTAATDLAACVRHLTAGDHMAPGRVVIVGASAGAIPALAGANLVAPLVGHVSVRAPFLDVIAVTSDPEAPLTLAERREWGDPDEDQVRDAMLTYSPYELADSLALRSILLEPADHDVRTPLHESTKFMARLRTGLADEACDALMLVDWEHGHSGSDSRRKLLALRSLSWAWTCDRLGVSTNFAEDDEENQERPPTS